MALKVWTDFCSYLIRVDEGIFKHPTYFKFSIMTNLGREVAPDKGYILQLFFHIYVKCQLKLMMLLLFIDASLFPSQNWLRNNF